MATVRFWPGTEISAVDLVAGYLPFSSLEREQSRCNNQRQVVADWVSSPMAASEQSSSQNLVLTDRPLSGIPYGRFGSNPDFGPKGEVDVRWRVRSTTAD